MRFFARTHTGGKKVYTADAKVFTSDEKVFTFREKVFTSDEKVFTSDEKVFTSDEKVFTSDEKVFTSDEKVFTSDEKVFTFDEKVFTSDEKVFTSDEKVFTSDEKVFTSDEKVFTFFPLPHHERGGSSDYYVLTDNCLIFKIERNMPGSFLERSETLVLEDMTHVCEECAKNLNIWKVPEEALEKMTVLVEKAQTAFDANKAKATKSAKTKAAKDIAFNEMKTYAREFISLLKFNLNIPNEMLIAMGLPSREHHSTPDPVPTEKGNVKHSVRGDMHKFSLNRQMDNQPVKSSISKVARGGTEWEYKKGDRPIIPVRSSRSSITIKTTEADKGEKIEARGRWVNAKYEPGPWSDWITIIIS